MAQKPLLGVVVLNWKRRDDSLACLASLAELDYPSVHVIFVDNASADGSADAVRRQFPEATVTENERNLGFAGGNNVGIRLALDGGADYVLVLNNDATVGPGLATTLVEYAERHPLLGAATPKILYADDPDRIWSAGYTFDLGRCVPQGRGWQERDTGQHEEPGPSAYAVGAALFMRRLALETVGHFDERFFLVFEDTDWSFRAREAGFHIDYVPQARVWHRASASFGRLGHDSPLYRYYWTRNSLLFTQVHVRPPRRWDAYRHILWRAARDAQHFLRLERPEGPQVAAAIVRAVVDFARGRFGGRYRS